MDEKDNPFFRFFISSITEDDFSESLKQESSGLVTGDTASFFFFYCQIFLKLSQSRVLESYGRVLLSGADTGVWYLLLTTSRPGIGEHKFRETDE